MRNGISSLFWKASLRMALKIQQPEKTQAAAKVKSKLKITVFLTAFVMQYVHADAFRLLLDYTSRMRGFSEDMLTSSLRITCENRHPEASILPIERCIDLHPGLVPQGRFCDLLQNIWKRCDHNHYYGFALQAATRHEKQKVVDLLLKRGAAANQIDGCHTTALQAAILSDNSAIVTALFDAGADPNARIIRTGSTVCTACKIDCSFLFPRAVI